MHVLLLHRLLPAQTLILVFYTRPCLDLSAQDHRDIFVLEDVEVSRAPACSTGFRPGLTGLLDVVVWLMDWQESMEVLEDGTSLFL